MKKRIKTFLRKICPLLASCLLIISLCGVVFVSADDKTDDELFPIPENLSAYYSTYGLYYQFEADGSNVDDSISFGHCQCIYDQYAFSDDYLPSYTLSDVVDVSNDQYTFGYISSQQNHPYQFTLNHIADGTGSPFRTFESIDLVRYTMTSFFALYDDNPDVLQTYLDISFNAYANYTSPYGVISDFSIPCTLNIEYILPNADELLVYTHTYNDSFTFTLGDLFTAIGYNGVVFIQTLTIDVEFPSTFIDGDVTYGIEYTSFSLSASFNLHSDYLINQTRLLYTFMNDFDIDVPDIPITPPDELYVDFTSWIATAVGGFLDFELMPGFALSGVLFVIIAFSIVMWWLKLFGGG